MATTQEKPSVDPAEISKSSSDPSTRNGDPPARHGTKQIVPSKATHKAERSLETKLRGSSAAQAMSAADRAGVATKVGAAQKGNSSRGADSELEIVDLTELSDKDTHENTANGQQAGALKKVGGTGAGVGTSGFGGATASLIPPSLQNPDNYNNWHPQLIQQAPIDSPRSEARGVSPPHQTKTGVQESGQPDTMPEFNRTSRPGPKLCSQQGKKIESKMSFDDVEKPPATAQQQQQSHPPPPPPPPFGGGPDAQNYLNPYAYFAQSGQWPPPQHLPQPPMMPGYAQPAFPQDVNSLLLYQRSIIIQQLLSSGFSPDQVQFLMAAAPGLMNPYAFGGGMQMPGDPSMTQQMFMAQQKDAAQFSPYGMPSPYAAAAAAAAVGSPYGNPSLGPLNSASPQPGPQMGLQYLLSNSGMPIGFMGPQPLVMQPPAAAGAAGAAGAPPQPPQPASQETKAERGESGNQTRESSPVTASPKLTDATKPKRKESVSSAPATPANESRQVPAARSSPSSGNPQAPDGAPDGINLTPSLVKGEAASPAASAPRVIKRRRRRSKYSNFLPAEPEETEAASSASSAPPGASVSTPVSAAPTPQISLPAVPGPAGPASPAVIPPQMLPPHMLPPPHMMPIPPVIPPEELASSQTVMTARPPSEGGPPPVEPARTIKRDYSDYVRPSRAMAIARRIEIIREAAARNEGRNLEDQPPSALNFQVNPQPAKPIVQDPPHMGPYAHIQQLADGSSTMQSRPRETSRPYGGSVDSEFDPMFPYEPSPETRDTSQLIPVNAPIDYGSVARSSAMNPVFSVRPNFKSRKLFETAMSKEEKAHALEASADQFGRFQSRAKGDRRNFRFANLNFRDYKNGRPPKKPKTEVSPELSDEGDKSVESEPAKPAEDADEQEGDETPKPRTRRRRRHTLDNNDDDNDHDESHNGSHRKSGASRAVAATKAAKAAAKADSVPVSAPQSVRSVVSVAKASSPDPSDEKPSSRRRRTSARNSDIKEDDDYDGDDENRKEDFPSKKARARRRGVQPAAVSPPPRKTRKTANQPVIPSGAPPPVMPLFIHDEDGESSEKEEVQEELAEDESDDKSSTSGSDYEEKPRSRGRGGNVRARATRGRYGRGRKRRA